MFRRLFCVFSAFAVLILYSASVFATGMEMGGSGFVPVGIQLDVVDLFTFAKDNFRDCINGIRHAVDEDVCPMAPQAGGRHKFNPTRTMVNGQIGLYYQCEYCGRNYGEALEEAYTDYVETLPGKQYNSDGAFLWVPGAADFSAVTVEGHSYYGGSKDFSYPAGGFAGTQTGGGSLRYGVSVVPGSGITVTGYNTLSYSIDFSVLWTWRVRVPVSGFFTTASGNTSISGLPFSAGEYLPLTKFQASNGSLNSLGTQRFFCSWPSFYVSGFEVGSGGNTFDIQNRFSGNGNAMTFGYVQDGNLVQSSVGTIYNETTNVYQNPVTGDTSTVTSWQYDYSDRRYTLTTDDSQQITVTYGDENVTINEGGTTYNVYYLAEEPEDVQEDVSHTHSWVSEVTTPPTCTGTGVRTLTCSECGWVRTETIPATGHSFSAPIITQEPTCTASGVRSGTCSVCGETTSEPVPALGHDYQSAVTLAPSCVNTGVRTFACSRCGDSYTVSIPATGHTWQVVSTVPTTYDNATGQLVQAGYTLYQCSVCGEQYKIEADSGGSSLPAPSTGGTSTGTDLSTEIDSSVGKGFLATIAHGLTEDLPEAVKAASSWFTTLPKLYEGFTGFLGVSVAWLPSDIQSLLRFAVGFPTFVGIIRKVWARG